MKYEELSEETLDNLRNAFRKTSVFQNCIVRIHKLKVKGFAAKMQEEIDYLEKQEREFIHSFCENQSDNRLTMKELAKEMDAVDFDKLSRRAHSVVLLSDVMDSCIRDMKEISDRYKDRFQIAFYEDLFNMGCKLRAYLDYQQKTRSPKVDQLYADVMDSVENYFDKRVVTLMKNMKKIDDQYIRKVEKEHRKKTKLIK